MPQVYIECMFQKDEVEAIRAMLLTEFVDDLAQALALSSDAVPLETRARVQVCFNIYLFSLKV